MKNSTDSNDLRSIDSRFLTDYEFTVIVQPCLSNSPTITVTFVVVVYDEIVRN